MAGKFVAFGQGLSGVFAGDEIIKGAMASYTFEHMEIAAYRALIAAAEELGDRSAAEMLKSILAQEEAAATWFADHLPELTARYLKLEEVPGIDAQI